MATEIKSPTGTWSETTTALQYPLPTGGVGFTAKAPTAKAASHKKQQRPINSKTNKLSAKAAVFSPSVSGSVAAHSGVQPVTQAPGPVVRAQQTGNIKELKTPASTEPPAVLTQPLTAPGDEVLVLPDSIAKSPTDWDHCTQAYAGMRCLALDVKQPITTREFVTTCREVIAGDADFVSYRLKIGLLAQVMLRDQIGEAKAVEASVREIAKVYPAPIFSQLLDELAKHLTWLNDQQKHTITDQVWYSMP
jgi:hypothetical protein